MLDGKRILAVVPARGGSKGIPNKNMQLLAGVSLIGWAGRTLTKVPFLDRRILSTDSPEYAQEGRQYGLEVPFLRPPHLSTDTASAIEVVQHALSSLEPVSGEVFDIVLIIEPTSPLRLPSDVEQAVRVLLTTGADSVVTVSPVPAKFHPLKALKIVEEQLDFYVDTGRTITVRQHLDKLYWRNGVCYALTRACIMERGAILGGHCVPMVVDHSVVNIDEPWELDWAEFLLGRAPPAFA